MKLITSSLLVLCMSAGPLSSAAALTLSGEVTADDTSEVNLLLNQMIPMRDGVSLSANIFMPAHSTSPLPALFVLTPYIADHNQHRGMYFPKHGYVFLSVDCRGRGNSEGAFSPLEGDGSDGYDICAWIAAQPWCNGKIGMLGGSYKGMTQWMTLKEQPPNLETIVPTASCAPGIDFPHHNNIPYPYNLQWLALTYGNASNTKLFNDREYWDSKYLRLFRGEIPFSGLPGISGMDAAVFDRWVEHPSLDSYWESFQLSRDDYTLVDIPILTITGHFDDDQLGAMHYYHAFMKNAGNDAKKKHYLLIGPWDHSGTRRPKASLGGIEFGENAVVDVNRYHLEWFDWTMKDGPRPSFLPDRVAYYLMGTNEWRTAGGLGDFDRSRVKWYLSSKDGEANDVFHSGFLAREHPGDQPPDSFEHDPLGTQPDKREADFFYARNDFLTDESDVYRDGRLIYHSLPFEEDVELTGYVQFDAYLSMNVPDTDLRVDLYEISPEGESFFMTHDIMRARYRNSLRKEELAVPGEIDLYRFDRFSFFSRTVSKGSRLRLVIKCLNSPVWQKNFNSGGVVALETAKDARKAVITLHHDRGNPSVLELPVRKD